MKRHLVTQPVLERRDLRELLHALRRDPRCSSACRAGRSLCTATTNSSSVRTASSNGAPPGAQPGRHGPDLPVRVLQVYCSATVCSSAYLSGKY